MPAQKQGRILQLRIIRNTIPPKMKGLSEFVLASIIMYIVLQSVRVNKLSSCLSNSHPWYGQTHLVTLPQTDYPKVWNQPTPELPVSLKATDNQSFVPGISFPEVGGSKGGAIGPVSNDSSPLKCLNNKQSAKPSIHLRESDIDTHHPLSAPALKKLQSPLTTQFQPPPTPFPLNQSGTVVP